MMALYSYLFGEKKVDPPPKPKLPSSIGFQWVKQAGAPAAISTYWNAAGRVIPIPGPGIYIGCALVSLEAADHTDFVGEPAGGDGADPGPFYARVAASTGLIDVVKTFATSINDRLGAYLDLLQGYFAYTAQCLDTLAANPVGSKIIDGILATEQTVWILPARGGNNVKFVDLYASMNAFAQLLDQRSTAPALDEVTRLVGLAFPGATQAAALQQLADAINDLPLYSLFAAPSHAAGFLRTPLHAWLEADLDGPTLAAWLDGKAPRLAALLSQRTAAGSAVVDGVLAADYLRAALSIILSPHATPGGGAGSSIGFNVTRAGANLERPPEIGLGHELVHALHSAAARNRGATSNTGR